MSARLSSRRRWLEVPADTRMVESTFPAPPLTFTPPLSAVIAEPTLSIPLRAVRGTGVNDIEAARVPAPVQEPVQDPVTEPMPERVGIQAPPSPSYLTPLETTRSDTTDNGDLALRGSQILSSRLDTKTSKSSPEDALISRKLSPNMTSGKMSALYENDAKGPIGTAIKTTETQTMAHEAEQSKSTGQNLVPNVPSEQNLVPSEQNLVPNEENLVPNEQTIVPTIGARRPSPSVFDFTIASVHIPVLSRDE